LKDTDIQLGFYPAPVVDVKLPLIKTAILKRFDEYMAIVSFKTRSLEIGP
jgi:hypothetical protein